MGLLIVAHVEDFREVLAARIAGDAELGHDTEDACVDGLFELGLGHVGSGPRGRSATALGGRIRLGLLAELLVAEPLGWPDGRTDRPSEARL